MFVVYSKKKKNVHHVTNKSVSRYMFTCLNVDILLYIFTIFTVQYLCNFCKCIINQFCIVIYLVNYLFVH